MGNSPNASIKTRPLFLELNLRQDTFKPLNEQNIAQAREQKLQMQAPRATEHGLVLVNKNAKLNEANIQPSWTNKLGQ